MDGWVDGWADGLMGGWGSRFKDCLQQLKTLCERKTSTITSASTSISKNKNK